MIRTRSYTSSDYPLVSTWWDQWGWPPVPETSLPGVGLIVEADGVPVCAGWLIQTDTDIAWSEWIVRDKKAGKATAKTCLDTLIQKIAEVAKQMGFKNIWTSLCSNSLKSKYQSHGFTVADTGMTNMVRVL